MVADLLDQLFFIHRFYHLLSARGASGACTYAQTYRSYAVARSNVALPALRPFDPSTSSGRASSGQASSGCTAAWDFPFLLFSFFRSASEKTKTEKDRKSTRLNSSHVA